MQKMGSLSLSHSLSWMNEGMAKFGAMSCPIFMGAISARSGMYQTTFLYVLWYECNFIVQSEQK